MDAIDKSESGAALAVYSVKDGEGWHRLGDPLENQGSLLADIAEMKRINKMMVPTYVKCAAFIAPKLEDEKLVREAVLRHILDKSPEDAAGAITTGLLGCLERVEGVAFTQREDGRVLVNQVSDGERGYYVGSPQEILDRAVEICEACPDAYLSFAGHLFGGSAFFVCVGLGDFEINGEPHERYLTLTQGFDGTKSIEIVLSVVRSVCANTVGMATNDAINATLSGHAAEQGKGYAKIKNTKSAPERLERAATAFRAILDSFGKIKMEQEVSRATPLTAKEAEKALQEMLWASGVRSKAPVDSQGNRIIDPRTKLPVEASPQGKKALADCLAMLHDTNGDAAHLTTPKGELSLCQVWQAVTNLNTHGRSIKGAKGPDAALKQVEYKYRSGASNLVAASEVMRDVLHSKIAAGQVDGVSLDDAGIHLGEVVGTEEGEGIFGALVQ